MGKKEKKSFFESPLMRSKIKSSNVTLFPEAGLGYLVGPLLALVCNGVINIWLVQYWDKVLGLGQWSPIFETILPIVSAIVIVIGNLFVGRLMERKPSIAGKARPLLLLGMPLVAIALLVLFIVPLPGAAVEGSNTGFADGGLIASIFIAVGYNLYYALAWPIYYTSHSALVNLSTRDGGKRSLLSTCIMAAQLGAAGLSGMAGGILVDLLGLLPKYSYTEAYKLLHPELVANFTNDYVEVAGLIQGVDYTIDISRADANGKWTILMIIMIVALIIGCLLEYFFTRERITEENVKIAEAEEANGQQKEVKKVSMAEQMKICTKDKYWWIIIIFFFLYQFGGMMKNNDLSFYSQAMTGGNTLSSLINTVGAIPTALGMAIVWPIAAKIGKSKTISLGGILALIGGAIAFIGLVPGLNDTVYLTLLDTPLTTSGILAVVSFIIKALGTAPAMYISLAVMALVLDHQEATHGVRTDGFTMAVYGSIMVAMSGICNGIIVGINALCPDVATKQVVHTILSYGVEAICYLVMAVMFIFMDVERFTKVDNAAIIQDQKAKVLAEGGEWIEPAERARLEEEENDRLVVEAHVAQLEIDCKKKGLDFEIEKQKYLNQHKQELEAAAQRKVDEEAKRAAKEAALPQNVIEKRNNDLQKALAEFNEIRKANGKDPVTL